jgi:hypothetical protein
MRIVGFFICTFGLLSLADAATTREGMQRGFGEMNPLSDTRSLWTLLRPELVILVAGAIAIGVGMTFLRRRDMPGVAESRREFFEWFWRPSNLPGAILVFLPVAIAIGRVLPVTSNLLMLSLGWSPWMVLVDWVSDMLGLSPRAGMLVVQGTVCGLLALPFTEVIRKIGWREKLPST